MRRYTLPWHRRYNWRRKDVIEAAVWAMLISLAATGLWYSLKYETMLNLVEVREIKADIALATVDNRIRIAEEAAEEALEILGGYRHVRTEDGTEKVARVVWHDVTWRKQ